MPSRKLDPKAVQEADNAFWNKYPDMRGKPIKDRKQRNEWWAYYNAAKKKKAAPKKTKPPKASSQPCPLTCTVTALDVTCSHGRKSILDLLEVVPAETGDKIVAKAKLKNKCGKHPTISVDGYWTSTFQDSQCSFRANAWRVGKPLDWLANVSPHQYMITADACSGSPFVTVKAYPSDKLSIKLNNNTWKMAKEKLDFVVKGVLGAYVKDPKFQILEGSGQIDANWEEYTDNRAFYKYEGSVGFNPILGAKIRIPFGPTAVIPQWLKKYGDAYFFVEFSGGLNVNGHWGRKTPDAHQAWADATGYIKGKIGASLFLMDPLLIPSFSVHFRES